MRASLLHKKYLHIILPVFIGSVIAYLDRVNIAYAALTMNADLGFSAQVYGAGAGIFFIGYILFEVPGAIIAERWSPRSWLARILVTWGMISVFMAFIRSPWQFYLVRFLLGAAEASFYPVVYASVIPRWFTPQERPKAIALMLTSLQASAILGAPFAGWLLDISAFGLSGWQMLFMLEALPALVFGAVIIFILPDRPADARWLTPEERRNLTDCFLRETAEKKARRRYSIWQAMADPEVLKLCLIYFLWCTGFWGFNYWMPTALKELSGWSHGAIGWLVALPMALSMAVMLSIAASSARTGEKRWHGALPLFAAAIGMAAGACTTDPRLNFMCVCLTAIGVYGAFGVWWSYPTSFLSGTAAAAAVGLINSCGNTGGYVGPYLNGFVKQATGSFFCASLILSAMLAAGGALMLTLKNRSNRLSGSSG